MDHWHNISFGICMEVYCFERFVSSTVAVAVVLAIVAVVGIAAEVDGNWNSLTMVLNKFRLGSVELEHNV